MFRRRARDQHRSAIRLSLFDAILLAPVILLKNHRPVVVGLALFSMVRLLVLTGVARSATIIGDVVRSSPCPPPASRSGNCRAAPALLKAGSARLNASSSLFRP